MNTVQRYDVQGAIETFVLDHIGTLLGTLKQQGGFPGLCYSASHLLASYLSVAEQKKVTVMCGTFGVNQCFHTWLVYEDTIFDVTLFQFHTQRKLKREYQKMSIHDIKDHLFTLQGGVRFDPEHSQYKDYHPLAAIEPDFCDTVKPGMSFPEFLAAACKTEAYKQLNWLDGRVTDSKLRFNNWLMIHQKRITKRFFTKYAIVDQ